GRPQPGPHPVQTARFPERDLQRHLLHANPAEPPRILPLLLAPVPRHLVQRRVPTHRDPEVVAKVFGEDPDVRCSSVLFGKLGEEAAQFIERLRREAVTGMALLKAIRPQAVAFRVNRDRAAPLANPDLGYIPGPILLRGNAVHVAVVLAEEFER